MILCTVCIIDSQIRSPTESDLKFSIYSLGSSTHQGYHRDWHTSQHRSRRPTPAPDETRRQKTHIQQLRTDQLGARSPRPRARSGAGTAASVRAPPRYKPWRPSLGHPNSARSHTTVSTIIIESYKSVLRQENPREGSVKIYKSSATAIEQD